MLATLRFQAVLLGVGAGALVATLFAVVSAVVLTALGVEDGAAVGLAPSIVAGFVAGGVVAGRGATVSHRFHGSVTGLVIAGLVVAVARLGGSPAPTPQVLLIALLGVVAGGLGGAIAGRRRGR